MARILIIALLLYVAVALLITLFQRRLLYFPDKKIGLPENYLLQGFEERFTSSADGVKLLLWHKQPTAGMPTIIYFHGNAMHLGNRAESFAAFANEGFGVLALSYRGYGKSEGAPSEAGIMNDARAAMRYATEALQLAPSQILLYGESLGTGVAVRMAAEFKVGGLALQSPYISVVQRASEIYWFLPVRRLIRDHFDSHGHIHKGFAPVIIFHGKKDVTIPHRHGETMLQAANEPKEAVFFDHVGHMDFDFPHIAQLLRDFSARHGLIQS